MTLLADRISYVNPVLVNEAAQGALHAAARLLEYERFHDRLEIIKMKSGSLPAAVEQRVGQSIQGTIVDAQAMSRLLTGLVAELEEVGVMAALIPSLAYLGPASVPELLKGRSAVLEDRLEQSGMPRELWRWWFKHVKWDELSFTTERGAIVMHKSGHRIGAITGDRKPAGDAASFVSRALGLPSRYIGGAGSEGAGSVTPAAIVQIAMRQVEAFYESRAKRTATDGVQVLPTGFPILIVFLIIAAAILITGIVLNVLCGNGVITDKGVCAVANYFILVGFLSLFGNGIAGQSQTLSDADTDPSG